MIYGKKIQEDEDDERYLDASQSASDDCDKKSQPIAEEEDDPLQNFMKGLEQEPKQTNKNQINEDNLEQENVNVYGGEMKIEEKEEFMDGSDEEIQYQKKKKIIQALKPFDFSTVVLNSFNKDFYEEHEEITNMDQETYKKVMKQFEIKIKGENIIKPIISFAHLPFSDKMFQLIADQGYERPTPIQAQALPCILSGRDVVGIAKTGSGKTLAFVWPMVLHVCDQNRADKGQGPTALILAPTRQLCQQIYIETKKFTKKQSLRVECLLGGENKHEQWKTLKAGVDILIASPGRLIEFIRKKATNMMRVTYLVLDEADRMLSLGFQQQIRSIVSQIREDRQTLLFTATMKKSMQLLVGDIVNYPLRIMVGDQEAANEDVKQEVVVMKEEEQKLQWMKENIYRIAKDGKVLIFVNQKAESESLGALLSDEFGLSNVVLHGDKSQYERTTIMNSFKKQQNILIATDIASRGIDVKNIKTVINYEAPKNIEVYIHRIGRAGRAGQTGTAYSFLMPSNLRLAVSLVKVFENSGYPVSDELQELAMLDETFHRKRISSRMGVTFAKGKDASKFLNHALKKQRKGFSRAGLGLDQHKDKKRTQYTGTLNLTEEIQNTDQMSIGDLSKLIKERIEEKKGKEKFDGHFVLGSKTGGQEDIKESTIVYRSKK